MLRTDIIPANNLFGGKKENLNFQAICIFAATGFFLDTDTYYTGLYSLPPASEISFENQSIISKPYFEWNYNPRRISFETALQEFTNLFESIVDEQTSNHRIILPLSGGLDSRTQAAALHHLKKDVFSYTYEFAGGINESIYGKEIAQVCSFPFTSMTIQEGYLWTCIDELAKINQCYSEFTHPRQMAFLDEYEKMGSLFSLGHWGDVLFDDMGVNDNINIDIQMEIVLKKILKKGGLELGQSLWKSWDLPGNFYEYLKERIFALLSNINIPNSANARIRAFKSMYWATRWTSVNLSVFEKIKPISLPYYDNRICKWICSVPEEYLSGRKLQIAYLKQRAPKLAKITWQAHRPFNLYTYHWNVLPYNLPYRVLQKIKRVGSSQKFIQRNWELQFLGTNNEAELCKRLFQEPAFASLVSNDLVKDFYDKFKNENMIYYSHSVSMLLTLSLFAKHFTRVDNKIAK